MYTNFYFSLHLATQCKLKFDTIRYDYIRSMIQSKASINKPHKLLSRIVFSNLDVFEELGFRFMPCYFHNL